MCNGKRIRVATCTASMLVFGFAQSGWSFEAVGSGGVRSQPNVIEGTPFTEGLNPGVPVEDSRIYGASWYALPYTPSVTYRIERVEFIHGEATGTIDIQIRPDNSGVPSNTILTQGSHELQQAVGFQGADMSPVELTAGTPYWVVFHAPLNSQASVGGGGLKIEFLYGSDGTTWHLRAPAESWIARFFGDIPIAVTPMTWGDLKARYRHIETLGRP
jgi:hypothetical protein